MAPTPTTTIATLSTPELMEETASTSRQLAALAGRIVLLAAELDRREAWREEGATNLTAWLSERCAVSPATARAWAHVGDRLAGLPALTDGLCTGAVSFDQVRAVVDVARPENEAALVAQASECSVRQLADVAKAAAPSRPSGPSAQREHEGRSVRFNDDCRTVTAQLPAEAYAEVRAGLEQRAKQVPSDGETRWDQRLADALVSLVRSRRSPDTTDEPSPYVVVAHVPLATLTDEDSELAGELEHRGLIDAVVARRLACDATLVVALDDDVGTRCTRAGPAEIRPRPSAASSGAETDIAASPDAETRSSSIPTTSSGGNATAARPISTTWRFSVSTTTVSSTPRLGRWRAMPTTSSASSVRAAGS